MDNATSVKLAGENPDYGIRKLFETIENKQYPSWTVYVVSILARFFV
jgi:catalase